MLHTIDFQRKKGGATNVLTGVGWVYTTHTHSR